MADLPPAGRRRPGGVYEISVSRAKSLAFDVRACVAGRTGGVRRARGGLGLAWLTNSAGRTRTASVDFCAPVQDTKFIAGHLAVGRLVGVCVRSQPARG
jgi:hypothetical protein